MESLSTTMTLIILLLIVILFVAVSFSNKRISTSKKETILKRLKELELTIQGLESASRRDAVIKLDNLLAKALQYYFHNSESCGYNLKKANKLFKKRELDDIWSAHKTRNDVVHDDYEVKVDEALKLYNVYKFSIKKILK